jgi:hypothetical protein
MLFVSQNQVSGRAKTVAVTKVIILVMIAVLVVLAVMTADHVVMTADHVVMTEVLVVMIAVHHQSVVPIVTSVHKETPNHVLIPLLNKAISRRKLIKTLLLSPL